MRAEGYINSEIGLVEGSFTLYNPTYDIYVSVLAVSNHPIFIKIIVDRNVPLWFHLR